MGTTETKPTLADLERLVTQAEMLAAPLIEGGELQALRQHHLETADALREVIASRRARASDDAREVLRALATEADQ